jgi:hypothetical protein
MFGSAIIIIIFFFGGGVSGPSIFSDCSFQVHQPVNQEERHLLAHAMASDFSVARQIQNLDFY